MTLNNSSGNKGADDFSFGFSDTDGWLGGTDGFSSQPDSYGNNGFSSQPDSYGNNGFSSQPDSYGNNGFSGQPDSYGNNGFSGQPGGYGNNGFSSQPDSYGNNGFSSQPDSYGNNGFSSQPGGYGNNGFSGQPENYGNNDFGYADKPLSRGDFLEPESDPVKKELNSVWESEFSRNMQGRRSWETRHPYASKAVKRKKQKSRSANNTAIKVFLGWIFVSIVLTALAAWKHEFWTITWFILQMTAGITIYSCSLPKNKLKLFTVYLIAVVLLTGALIGARCFYPDVFRRLSFVSAPTDISISFVASFGLFIMVYSIASMHNRKIRCTEKVNAICLEVLRHRSKKGGTTYCPVYGFLYRGNKYIVKMDYYSNISPPSVNSECDLMINPDAPEDFYDVRRDGTMSILLILIGLLWAGACYFLLIRSVITAF